MTSQRQLCRFKKKILKGKTYRHVDALSAETSSLATDIVLFSKQKKLRTVGKGVRTVTMTTFFNLYFSQSVILSDSEHFFLQIKRFLLCAIHLSVLLSHIFCINLVLYWFGKF